MSLTCHSERSEESRTKLDSGRRLDSSRFFEPEKTRNKHPHPKSLSLTGRGTKGEGEKYVEEDVEK
jgi:hypothetical protein